MIYEQKKCQKYNEISNTNSDDLGVSEYASWRYWNL